MRRTTTVAFALLASLLLVTALPVSAGHDGFVVGSQHSSDTDFQNAESLEDVTVDGAGEGASVRLPDLEYSVIQDSGDGDANTFSGFIGDDSNNEPFESEARIEPTYTGPIETVTLDISEAFDDGYQMTVDVYAVQEAPDGTYGEGTLIKDGWNPSFSTGEKTIETDTSVTVEEGETWTLEFVTRSSDNDDGLDRLSVQRDESFSETWGSRNGETFQDGWDIDIGGGTQPSGTYISPPHNVSNAEEAWTNLTLDNATADVTIQTDSDGDGAFENYTSSSYSASGNRTVDISGANTESWRVRVDFEKTATDADAQLHDEGILYSPRSPEINESSASPVDETVSGPSTDLSINVSDHDFGVGGDELTVTFVDESDGSTFGTDTVTSNGTASTTVSQLSGGEIRWSVLVEDQQGHEIESSVFTFDAPLTVFIHDGEDRSTLVDDRDVEVETIATADGSNFRDVQTVSDGSFTVGGMPDEQLLVTLNASGYAPRTMIIDEPYAQANRRTLLYDENSSYEQCFQLESSGAGFSPDSTWLIIQSYINDSWRDSTGTYFGATNTACQHVEDGENYRLVVQDEEDRRSLGGHTADQGFENNVLGLVVEGIEFSFDRGTDFTYEATSEVNETDDTGQITFAWTSRDAEISDLSIEVREFDPGSGTGEAIFSDSHDGEVDDSVWSVPLNENQTSHEWVVIWEATRGTSEQLSGQVRVAPGSPIGDFGLDPQLAKFAAGGLVLLVAGIFGLVHAGVGALVTGVVVVVLHVAGYLTGPSLAFTMALTVGVLGFAVSKGGG